jgi:signal transduction histidine kinase
VEDALDLAAVQEGRISMAPEAINITDTAVECFDVVRPLARQRDVVLRLGGGCVRDAAVVADPARFRQVLLNLLSNAVKYNRFAGDVEISWSTVADGRWRIRVADTGPGIPKEMLSRLFERYDRVWADDSGVEGTGLGLAIARKLLVMMGGEIGVESSPGEGSSFWIDLPPADPARVRLRSPGVFRDGIALDEPILAAGSNQSGSAPWSPPSSTV